MPDPYNNPYPNPYQNSNSYQSPYQNQNGYPPNGDEPGKSAAIASLVLGIIGLCFTFVGLIVGIIGLYYAAKAKREGFEGGLRMAGFVLSLLSLIFGGMVLSCIICYGGLACAGASYYGYYY